MSVFVTAMGLAACVALLVRDDTTPPKRRR